MRPSCVPAGPIPPCAHDVSITSATSTHRAKSSAMIASPIHVFFMPVPSSLRAMMGSIACANL